MRGLDAYGALHVCFIEPSDIIVYRDRYVSTTKANSASAALNKWLKVHVSRDVVVHSLRHAMRDRLRAVECPTDIIDQIGGWSRKGVGESYGRGYQVEQLWRWMAKAVG